MLALDKLSCEVSKTEDAWHNLEVKKNIHACINHNNSITQKKTIPISSYLKPKQI